MNGQEAEKEEYFISYDNLEVHKLMLEDVPRTTAYQQAIEMSGEVLRDKVVLGTYFPVCGGYSDGLYK